jgi:hypothetical protein
MIWTSPSLETPKGSRLAGAIINKKIGHGIHGTHGKINIINTKSFATEPTEPTER